MINTKPVYMFDLEGNFIKKFETTLECAMYFDVDPLYINHNLKYCKKIRYKKYKWYKISREENLKNE